MLVGSDNPIMKGVELPINCRKQEAVGSQESRGTLNTVYSAGETPTEGPRV